MLLQLQLQRPSARRGGAELVHRPPPAARAAGADLRAALDAVLVGQPAPKARPSIGCNIKWHPGQEPDYYGTQIVKK
jgi:hypothetical protein